MIKKFQKEYSIEWIEECEAVSMDEAEKVLDCKARLKDNGEGVQCSSDVELIED